MSLEYEEYERKCNEIHKTNKGYLAEFEQWLANKGLTQRTIDNHVTNVDFYINHYLCYYDALEVWHGCYGIGMFLGYWFIRKAMWSSCGNIKSSAAGIKKFYRFLLESNVIEQEDYDTLCLSIKAEMPEWLDEMRRYDDLVFGNY